MPSTVPTNLTPAAMDQVGPQAASAGETPPPPQRLSNERCEIDACTEEAAWRWLGGKNLGVLCRSHYHVTLKEFVQEAERKMRERWATVTRN